MDNISTNKGVLISLGGKKTYNLFPGGGHTWSGSCEAVRGEYVNSGRWLTDTGETKKKEPLKT